MSEFKSIPCGQIVPSPVNRRKGRTYGIDALAESISKRGLIQRPLVRPLGDKYELVAGERRWRACSKIMDEIPVEIRELTDAEAHEITFSENFDREQLSPFEEAAFIDVMVEDGKTIDDIADRFGKTVKWVARRQKLNNLSPEIRSKIEENPDKGIAWWPVASLELLSRFEHHIQNDVVGMNAWINDFMPVDDLEQLLDSYIMRLDKVQFKPDDDTLVPGVGSCTLCCKRTSVQVNLFEPMETVKNDDRCIDRICFKKKQEAFVTRKAAALKEKNQNLLLIKPTCLAESSSILSDDSELKKEAEQEINFSDCRKDAPGAVQALYVDGPMAGKTKWVLGRFESTSKSKTSKVPQSHEDRVAAISKKRRVSVYDKLISILTNEKNAPSTIISRLQDSTVATMAVIWGCRRYDSVAEDPDFDMMADTIRQFNLYIKQRQKDALFSDLARCVLPGLIELLEYQKKSETVNLEFAEQLTDILGIDYKKIVTEAEHEIKEPKEKKTGAKKQEDEDRSENESLSDARVEAGETDKPKKKKRSNKNLSAILE